MRVPSIVRLGWCLSALTVLCLPALAAGQGLNLPKTEKPKTVPLFAPKPEAPKKVGSAFPPWAPLAVFGGVVVVLGVALVTLNNRVRIPELEQPRQDWNAVDVGGHIAKSSIATRLGQIGACLGVMVQIVIEGPPGLSGRIEWDRCMMAGLFAMVGGTVFYVIGSVVDVAQRRSE